MKQGSIAEINAIGDILRNYHTKNEMVEELLRRMDQPLEQELAPEDVIEQMEEPTVENVESYIPEAVDNVLEEILSSKETMSIFTSRSHEDENGNIDWKQLKDLAETDPEYFTGGFPFALNENEFENFKSLLNDTDRQRSIKEEISKYPRFESGGQGDIIRRGAVEDEEGAQPAEEPTEQPTEEPTGEPAENHEIKSPEKRLAIPLNHPHLLEGINPSNT